MIRTNNEASVGKKRSMLVAGLLAALVAVGAMLAANDRAHAATTFTVHSTTDARDLVINGGCATRTPWLV